jgi:cell division protein FtsX
MIGDYDLYPRQSDSGNATVMTIASMLFVVTIGLLAILEALRG